MLVYDLIHRLSKVYLPNSGVSQFINDKPELFNQFIQDGLTKLYSDLLIETERAAIRCRDDKHTYRLDKSDPDVIIGVDSTLAGLEKVIMDYQMWLAQQEMNTTGQYSKLFIEPYFQELVNYLIEKYGRKEYDPVTKQIVFNDMFGTFSTAITTKDFHLLRKLFKFIESYDYTGVQSVSDERTEALPRIEGVSL